MSGLTGDDLNHIRAARKLGTMNLEKAAKLGAYRMILETRNYESMLARINSRRANSEEKS